MWESRKDKFPPNEFYADLFQHIRNLFPGALIDEELARTLRDIWIFEWRNGQNAQDTAKATCSCDGKKIIPSPGAGRDLGKRLARPPQGAKRGDFIAPETLREVAPLASARRESEKLAKVFDRVRAATLKLLRASGWTPQKQAKLERLKALLAEIKRKHDAAVAKYEGVTRSRRETQQPALYAKPLGAMLSLRPDELPEPPPPKAPKAPKDKKPLKRSQAKPSAEPAKKPPTGEPPSEAGHKKGDCQECSQKKEKQPTSALSSQPSAANPSNGPPSQAGLWLCLDAAPNPDFGPGTRQATLAIPKTWERVASLKAARAFLLRWINTHAVGSGNFTPETGRVRKDGKPFARISHNGRIWQGWDADPVIELNLDGTPKAHRLAEAAPQEKRSREATQRAPQPAASTQAAQKPLLSEQEAEELANLFAKASLEDKAK